MGFLGLLFPALLAALVIVAVICFFIDKRVTGILLVVLLCGSYHITNLFSWHQSSFTARKPTGTIRVLGWNVMNFEKNKLFSDETITEPFLMFKYIQQQQPDILCMQDFFENGTSAALSNIELIRKNLGYPYYAFSNDYQEYTGLGPNYAGVAIFSKYPLKNVQRIAFPGKIKPHSILTADITIKDLTRRLIVTHLQSMHLRKLNLSDKAPYVWDEDSSINYNNSVLNKLSYYLPYHAVQADVVRNVIAASPYPVIFSADMNEVPSSYSYHVISSGLKDAFLEKGFGFGRTYYKISPTLRIDYLLHDPAIEVVQYKKDTVLLSDHYPQIIDIRW